MWWRIRSKIWRMRWLSFSVKQLMLPRTSESFGRRWTKVETARTNPGETLTKDNRRLQSRAWELFTELHGGSPVTRGRSYKPEWIFRIPSPKDKTTKDRNCSHSLSWLEDQGYIPTTVTMVNITTGPSETIKLHTDDLKEMFGEADEISEDAVNTINMMLYIKDWYNLTAPTMN